ncbi:alpha/beta hydrolase-fold protein [Clostridium sp. C8-1-8]|uniref:alpha/beta hydrolase n=1 Tax=Clostridium sp. C8-1-8 TaxID=2698831 RepID=UPI001369E99E|nr:alpha/beta hydrolase-fold protein [Clostridium sp. C8-1-8]
MCREFVDVDKSYYERCERRGKLVRINYISNTYSEDNTLLNKDALVYLPYMYDESDKKTYNVFYLMHGGGGNSDEVFGGIEGKTDLKNILDNMIFKGNIEPLIVVAPSFYYQGTTEALTSTKDARLLTENFHHELVRDLIPTVEKLFRVNKGRGNRAFGGYSMGSEATWNIYAKCLEYIKYYMPMSGDCWAVKLQGGLICPKETVNFLVNSAKASGWDFKIFACVGDDDVAYKPMDSMIHEMMTRKDCFIFAEDLKKGNIVYCVAHGGTHSYEYCYKYIYNALPHFFDKY